MAKQQFMDLTDTEELLSGIRGEITEAVKVTGVKGSAEIAYRTGEINISPSNLGLGRIDNTADVEKNVLSATKLTESVKIGDADFDGSKDITLEDMGVASADHTHNYAGSDTAGGAATEAKKLVITSRTYAGIYGSANTFDGATFYFATVLPDSYSTTWHVKYKITSVVPGQSNYSGFFEVDMWGTGASRTAYKIQNAHVSTSYRSLYYHVLYSATETGVGSGYGHALGIGLRSSVNRTSSTYARTFTIEILEADNCTVTMLDTMVKYAALDGTGSTNYSGYSEWDGYNNGLRETGDDNEYTQVNLSNTKFTAGSALYQYSLIVSPDHLNYYSVVTASGTGTAKSATTQGFRPETIKYYTGAAVAAGSTVTTASTTRVIYSSADFRYSSNCGSAGLTSGKPVFLKCSYNSETDLYTLVSTGWYAQDLPTEEDGYYYIYIGQAYSGYQCTLNATHDVYYYSDGVKQVGGASVGADVASRVNTLVTELKAFNYSRVKLLSEVTTTDVSSEGTVYIDVSDVNAPTYRVGDGKAYIIDLPVWDINDLKTTVDTLKDKSITADIDESAETLSLSFVFMKELTDNT